MVWVRVELMERGAFLRRICSFGSTRQAVVTVPHLFRHVGSGDAHGAADVGSLQGRRIVHTVTGDGNDVAELLGSLDDHKLLGGRGAGEHDLFVQKDVLDILGRHVLELPAGAHDGLGLRVGVVEIDALVLGDLTGGFVRHDVHWVAVV